MTQDKSLAEREISSLRGLSGFQINPLFGNGVRTVGDFERLGEKELIRLWGVGAITIKKVRTAIEAEKQKAEPEPTNEPERTVEDDAKRAGWDAYMFASGNGFKLTNAEAHLVHKLVSDVIARSIDETVQHEIGDASAVSTAMQLYMRLSEAMTE